MVVTPGGWPFTTENDVSATPTIFGSDVYVADWACAAVETSCQVGTGGNLFSIDQKSGKKNWSHKISEYNGVTGSMSRTSPAVDDKSLIIGDWPPGSQVGAGIWPDGEGAHIMAINRQTGTLLWITQVDSFNGSQITGSPIVYNKVVYVGISSSEEGLAENPSYACCVFRGSVVALDENTGRILWRTYIVPPGYS